VPVFRDFPLQDRQHCVASAEGHDADFGHDPEQGPEADSFFFRFHDFPPQKTVPLFRIKIYPKATIAQDKSYEKYLIYA
jgi:hypothetical protein